MLVALHFFQRRKFGLRLSKISSLQSTIILMQSVNLFVFPFPVRWITQKEKYKVSRSLLKYYWILVAYKLVHATFLAFMGVLSLIYEECQCNHLSLPIWFTNVAILIATSLIDITFVSTADEVVSSFNWSYQRLNHNLTNIKIGMLSLLCMHLNQV